MSAETPTTDPRRRIPPVDRLLDSPAFAPLLARYPRGRVVHALREALDAWRSGAPPAPASPAQSSHDGAGDELVKWAAARVADRLALADTPSLRPVINATGVVLHTNLGRAPLATEAREAMARAATGYSNLEFDLATGRRGSRYDHCVALLTELTGAEDALVVNNNAAALVLALNTVAEGRGVVVSRGELVEIGGGFRIPEILLRSGAALVEVGSTNRTRVEDYRKAAGDPNVAALLKVHRSNFRMEGFTEEVGLAALREVASGRGVPLLYDLGSGLLMDPARLGLPREPRAVEALSEGADVVAVSGDKLLGGPQAGILLGRAALIEAMRTNPLCRALRVDKVTLAGLEATLRLYRDPETALRRIPTLRMLEPSLDALRVRAERLAAGVDRLTPRVEAVAAQGTSAVGGGTYPGVTLPTWTLRLAAADRSAEALAAHLRAGDPPVVGRIEDEQVVLDLRTVDPSEDEVLEHRIGEALSDG